MPSLARWVTLALASGGFISYLPVWCLPNRKLSGAGILGTLWGVALLPWLPMDVWRQTLVLAGVVALAVVIGDLAEGYLGGKDDPRIVIDETVGYLIAMFLLPRSLPLIILAFVLFRVFDVWKPGWIRPSGNLPGGWGVVVDDVLAGVAANIILHLARLIYPI